MSVMRGPIDTPALKLDQTTRGSRSSGLRSARARSPGDDLWSRPQTDATLSNLDGWPRHVGIPIEVRGDTVPMGEPQQPRYLVGVDQVVDIDPLAHPASLHMLTSVSPRSVQSSSPRLRERSSR